MARFRRLLLATILATTLLGNATAAEGETTTESVASAFSVLANTTISCSAAWPSATLGCFLERPVLVLGALELAIGLDAQAVLTGALDGHLAPYMVLAYYADTWSAWTEVRLPELAGIKPLGSSDWFRIGFSYRIPP